MELWPVSLAPGSEDPLKLFWPLEFNFYSKERKKEWIRDKSSWEIKIDYIKCFVSLWIFARKRGWLGTNPGECPFDNGQVYVKKEIRKEIIDFAETADLPQLTEVYTEIKRLKKI